MSAPLADSDEVFAALESPPKKITVSWLWSVLMLFRDVRHGMQEELDELRQRVAYLEGRGVSGEQVKVKT